MLKLTIQLESPLCAGTGLSRPGVVDREVVFDDLGLPWLPARRLKGLLRDAYRELRAELPGLDLPAECALFGSIGAAGPGLLRIQNAFLKDDADLRPWVRSFVAGSRGHDRRASVMHAFSQIRRQTAMDRDTGSPKRDTLRATRVLHAGLVFEASVAASNDQAAWALALSAAALREMGSSRWRGLGRVRCTLQHGSDNLTETALSALSPTQFSPPPLTPATLPVSISGHTPSASATRPFSLRLDGLAIFPQLSGDPNTVSTTHFVPGAVIHGWFAQRYLRQHGLTDEFRAIFTSGRVVFGNATLGDPMPHSLRQSKDSPDNFFDLTQSEAVGVRRASGWLNRAELQLGRIDSRHADTQLHYHHARAQDPLLQRAVGVEQSFRFNLQPHQAGAFFQYEALSPGQSFSGELRGEHQLLDAVARLIADGDAMELGRSRSAQYGAKAVWQWQPFSPAPAQHASAELTIIALSPVISVNPLGHPVARFPLEELEAELGTSLKEVKQFSRQDWQGGYLSHQRLPRAQVPSWAAGSVLVAKTTSELPVSAAALTQASTRSYGLRREQGFGMVRILAGSAVSPRLDLRLLPTPLDRTVAGPASHPATRQLAERLFFEQVVASVRFQALLAARTVSRHPAKSLLHRLRLMLSAQTEPDFRRSLADLRSRAKKQLESCRIPELHTLFDHLQQDWSELGNSLLSRVYSEEIWQAVLPTRPRGRPLDGKYYFLELLAALAKQASRDKARQEVSA